MKKFLFVIFIAGGMLIASFYLPQGLKARQPANISKPSAPSAALSTGRLSAGTGRASLCLVFRDIRNTSDGSRATSDEICLAGIEDCMNNWWLWGRAESPPLR